MKKLIILFLLLTIGVNAQVSTGQEQEFDYGIKNNSTQTVTSPTYLVSNGTDGTYGKVLASNFQDVKEYASAINLPVTGVAGIIYVTKDNNLIYRWNGTIYQELSATDISGLQAQIDLKASTTHRTTHELGGTDVIQGENLSVNVIPPINNYSPTTSTLKGHLLGIDQALGSVQKNTAYVDINGDNATAVLGNIKKPFLSIDAALDALPSTGGNIQIGVGSFLSPNPAKIKSNTSFFGSGKPVTDSDVTYTTIGDQPTTSNPTKLVGGTILLGTFDGSLKDGIQLHNLGIDSGVDYCNTYKSGAAQEGLFFGQEYNLSGGLPSQDGIHQLQSNSPPRTGIVISNVSALCKDASSSVHAMLIENTLNAKVSNVSTYFGYHGLVIKSIGCEVTNFDGHGHEGNGLILKSNDYAYCYGNSVNNFYITSIGLNDGGGVRFVGDNGVSALFNNITNGTIAYTSYGIMNNGKSEGSNFSNINIFKTQGVGISLDSDFINSTFSNIDQREGTIGYLVNQNNSIAETSLVFTSCKSSRNSVKGFNFTATNLSTIQITNSYGDNLVNGSTVSGNIFGYFKETGIFSGTFKYNLPSATDYAATIDSNGRVNKSNVKIDSSGNITTDGTVIGKAIVSAIGASNTVGLGSSYYWDNNLQGSSKRLMIAQMNGSNGLDFWSFDGIDWNNTGVKINISGRISANPATAPDELVTKAQLDATGRPYKVYTALLTQTGTSAPTATILENTLGGVITWGYIGVGQYEGTLTNVFTSNKTASFISGQLSENRTYGIDRTTANTIRVISRDGGVTTNDRLTGASIEIRVYN